MFHSITSISPRKLHSRRSNPCSFQTEIASIKLSKAELLEAYEAVNKVVGQILDHYFDKFGDQYYVASY
jgi:hypothetical protein